ncbi:signal peptidase I, partial [Mesorhizobium sp. M00.F.Ca.ET.186.01.1.1]
MEQAKSSAKWKTELLDWLKSFALIG